MIHGTCYFKCNYCTQRYQSIEVNQNIRLHLTKHYIWDGLITVQFKKKTENMGIDDILA